RFLRPFEGLVTAAAVFQQGVGDQMGQGAELQIPLVAASALSRPEIFQPGIVHREVQQSPHRVGQGELLQHRCRKNVAVHNSKDSWVNSKRCQIGTYDTDFVSAEKRQHPELTAFVRGDGDFAADSRWFGRGLLTGPSSATPGLPVPGRWCVTWRPTVGRRAGSGDSRRTKQIRNASSRDQRSVKT